MNSPRDPISQARNAQRVSQHTPKNIEDKPVEHEAVHTPPRARTRAHKSTEHVDQFWVDRAKIPPDVDVEWKRVSNKGEEDPFYIARMREQGWEPVNPLDHPDWVPVPPGYDKPNIIKSGLMLMERPMSLTLEARAEERLNARNQIIEAEERLGKTPDGTLTRDHEGAKARIVKEYVRPIQVEE
jgi:hypothetical protein